MVKPPHTCRYHEDQEITLITQILSEADYSLSLTRANYIDLIREKVTKKTLHATVPDIPIGL